MPSFAAIIAGAGAGARLGANMPKALVLLDGEALIVHAVRGMLAAGIADIVVTVPEEYTNTFAKTLQTAGLSAKLVTGGATRQESVANGLAACNADYVLVHDAARALTPPEMIQTITAALKVGSNAVIPAVPVVDTIKSGTIAADSAGREKLSVAKTLNRSELYAIQTPQGFSRELLLRAHEAGRSLSATEANAAPDDAALVELLGERVEIVPGHPNALKITTPFDLQVAELMVCGRRS
ncbi:2-C-methyl-D-erythritol 4-phosphate cytidylyltransferase [Arcanobacterium hippocoleae]